MPRDFLFTSESVTEGHPDKVADQISDAVLDDIIRQDRYARVALETLLKTGFAIVAGEVTTQGYSDVPAIVRRVIKRIGYTDSSHGFDGGTCAVLTAIEGQSGDIARGVNANPEDVGAGDQGMMFGYAVDETPELMPATISLAHKLTRRLADARRDGSLDFLRPDGKSQVTIEYRDGRPHRIAAVVVSAQHGDIAIERVREGIRAEVIDKVLPREWVDKETKYHINPTGRFVIGGPMGDSGVTGRKIIVDSYGGWGRHGGGCFSGKDPTKVDRSAAYMGRYVAKNVVAAGLARRCEIQVAYAIAVPEPVSIMVETFGTAAPGMDEGRIADAVRRVFNFRPGTIIKTLDLWRPTYEKTAAYGHFGRSEPEFTWERTDRVEALREAAGFRGPARAASA
jgi:S-adenosylmethionine synthetase